MTDTSRSIADETVDSELGERILQLRASRLGDVEIAQQPTPVARLRAELGDQVAARVEQGVAEGGQMGRFNAAALHRRHVGGR
jgi:hypothetical protein